MKSDSLFSQRRHEWSKSIQNRGFKSKRVRGQSSCTGARTPSLDKFFNEFSTNTGGHLYTGESGILTSVVTQRNILLQVLSLGPLFSVKLKPNSHSSADFLFWLPVLMGSKMKYTDFLTVRTQPRHSIRRGCPKHSVFAKHVRTFSFKLIILQMQNLPSDC